MATGTSVRSPQRGLTASTAIKAAHTVVFLVIASSVLYTLYSGLTGRVSKLTRASIMVVLGESVIFFLNRGRCPLTDLAEVMGADDGSVSDTFLPGWFARRTPVIFYTLFSLGLAALGLRRLVRPVWLGHSATPIRAAGGFSSSGSSLPGTSRPLCTGK